MVNQHGLAGHKAGGAGFELVNQHGLGHKELVNQHGLAGHKAGVAGFELVSQLVLIPCLIENIA